MYRKAINIIRKLVHQFGSIYKRLYADSGQQNVKSLLFSLMGVTFKFLVVPFLAWLVGNYNPPTADRQGRKWARTLNSGRR